MDGLYVPCRRKSAWVRGSSKGQEVKTEEYVQQDRQS